MKNFNYCSRIVLFLVASLVILSFIVSGFSEDVIHIEVNEKYVGFVNADEWAEHRIWLETDWYTITATPLDDNQADIELGIHSSENPIINTINKNNYSKSEVLEYYTVNEEGAFFIYIMTTNNVSTNYSLLVKSLTSEINMGNYLPYLLLFFVIIALIFLSPRIVEYVGDWYYYSRYQKKTKWDVKKHPYPIIEQPRSRGKKLFLTICKQEISKL